MRPFSAISGSPSFTFLADLNCKPTVCTASTWVGPRKQRGRRGGRVSPTSVFDVFITFVIIIIIFCPIWGYSCAILNLIHNFKIDSLILLKYVYFKSIFITITNGKPVSIGVNRNLQNKDAENKATGLATSGGCGLPAPSGRPAVSRLMAAISHMFETR